MLGPFLITINQDSINNEQLCKSKCNIDFIQTYNNNSKPRLYKYYILKKHHYVVETLKRPFTKRTTSESKCMKILSNNSGHKFYCTQINISVNLLHIIAHNSEVLSCFWFMHCSFWCMFWTAWVLQTVLICSESTINSTHEMWSLHNTFWSGNRFWFL